VAEEKNLGELKEANKSKNNPLRAYKLSQESLDKKSNGSPHARMNIRPDITASMPANISFYQAPIPGTEAFLCIGSDPNTFNEFKGIKLKIGRNQEIKLTKEDFYIAGTQPPS